MIKTLIILLVCSLLVRAGYSQVCVQTNCKQTITVGDSSSLWGMASSGFGVVSYQWSQVTGPGVAVLKTPTSSVTGVKLPVAGTYIFSLTGVFGNGIKAIAQDTLVVLPPIKKIVRVITVYSDSTQAITQ